MDDEKYLLNVLFFVNSNTVESFKYSFFLEKA